MKVALIALVLVGCTPSIQGQLLIPLQIDEVGTFEVTGDLTNGQLMSDLSWAWNSSVACFPQTEVEHFTGNHVLYTCNLPAYTEFEITVIPADPTADFSLYAYEVGRVTPENTVPRLSSCVRCEVDHRRDRPRRGPTQDHTRTITDILAIRNPYQVVIGVVGAQGLTRGAYTLRIIARER